MTAARYPLTVALAGGRVRHSARLVGNGPQVTTLCRKRGHPASDGAGLPYCAACAKLPNPISQQTTGGTP
jgi:hypothetical protein